MPVAPGTPLARSLTHHPSPKRIPLPSCSPSLLRHCPREKPSASFSKVPIAFPSVSPCSCVSPRLDPSSSVPRGISAQALRPSLSFLCQPLQDASRIMLRSASGLQGQVQILRFSTWTPPNVTLALSPSSSLCPLHSMTPQGPHVCNILSCLLDVASAEPSAWSSSHPFPSSSLTSQLGQHPESPRHPSVVLHCLSPCSTCFQTWH